MSKLSQGQIVGIDVSRDWLDIHCLPDGARLRWPNNDDGHTRIASLAAERHALVCFEGCEDQKTIRGIVFPSGGGQEWRLWSTLENAGVATRQLPPAQSEPLMRHWFEHNGERIRCEPGHTGQDGSD